MMPEEENLQLYFKEFIKDESHSRGIDRIRPAYRQAGKNPDYVCDLFVYEPRNVEEAQLGTLFMLGKINNIPKNKYRNFDFLLSLLISVIKREFYSDSGRLTAEALGASLNKANLYLADFTEKGNVEWIGNLTFICGAFSKNTFHVTQAGRPIIKLFRGTTINHIENKFPAQKKHHPLKTFGNIASGTILNGDKIVLGLKETPKGTCDQIIEFFKKTIEDKIDKSPMVCLVLEAKDASEKMLVCEKVPQQDKLLKQRPVRIKVRKIAIIIFSVIYKIISFLLFVSRKLYKFLAPIFRKISKTGFYKLIFPIFLKTRPQAKKLSSKIKTTYYILYQKNRPAFFVVSALIILILILPFSIAQKINYYIKINNFNKLSAEIQEIQRRADMALIYQDKNRAKGLLQKNQALIAELLNYFEKSPKAIILQEKHQNQQDSINNVIRIKELEKILDFSTTGFIVNPVGINKIKDALYFYELDSGILYKFNENKDLVLVFISAKDELRKMVSLENDQIVLFGQSGKIYLYDSNTNDYNTHSPDPAISIEEIKDVKSFLSNFYVLNTKSGIIKYSNELKEDKWLSEQLEDAQSMAIDGSIYILSSNGIINRYFRGKKADETQPRLEKPLEGNNKIFIKEDFRNFYISDPKNKRLIVLNKNGEIINQYVNDEFSNLQDFWVTNDEKEIYLLCGKKVFKLNL